VILVVVARSITIGVDPVIPGLCLVGIHVRGEVVAIVPGGGVGVVPVAVLVEIAAIVAVLVDAVVPDLGRAAMDGWVLIITVVEEHAVAVVIDVVIKQGQR